MGNYLRSLIDRLTQNINASVLMLGLDCAGKSTILYKLKLGEVITTVPTIGLNCEQITYRNLNMTVMDIGGQDKLRPLWRYYYTGANALIYVVDSCDAERFGESRDQLQRILSDDQLAGIPLLVFANKQDLPGACQVPIMAEELQLTLIRDRQWHIQATSAVNGEGLYEGLEWLLPQIKIKKD